MKTKVSFFQRVRYNIENALSRGNSSVILWLGFITILILIICASILVLIDVIIATEKGIGFLEALHETFYQILAPGGIDWEKSVHYRIMMAILCLVSLFVASILIGLISSTIEGKIEELRRGRSIVLEKEHLVIYGWSSKIFLIIQQLVTANENRKKFCIAVMADKDKVEMESAIREKIEDFKTTRLIVRSGNPNDIEDVNIMMPQLAKAIIILPQESEFADMNVVKTLMAIANNPKRKEGKYSIITEINDPGKKEVADIIAGNEATIIQTADTISRLMVQTCLQPGLSTVYNEFLSFEGVEIYFKAYEGSMGTKFKDVCLHFENAIVMGLIHSNGNLELCPPADTYIPEGSTLVCLAEDDDSFSSSKDKSSNSELIKQLYTRQSKSEKTLIIGWNAKSPIIIRELDSYLQPGSQITILSNRDVVEEVNKLRQELKHASIDVYIGDTTDDAFLLGVDLKSYQHALLLSYDHLSEQDSDAHTLITLIQLRNLSQKLGLSFNIVSEMLDLRNKTLAELAKPDDFIIGNNITSLILTQLSENPKLIDVYKEIFSASGSEMYLRPIEEYVEMGVSLNFNTLSEAALRYGEVAVGYKKQDISENYGIVLNPIKHKKTSFSSGDKLIVLAK